MLKNICLNYSLNYNTCPNPQLFIDFIKKSPKCIPFESIGKRILKYGTIMYYVMAKLADMIFILLKKSRRNMKY